MCIKGKILDRRAGLEEERMGTCGGMSPQGSRFGHASAPGVLNLTKYTTTEKGSAAQLALYVVGGSRGVCTQISNVHVHI